MAKELDYYVTHPYTAVLAVVGVGGHALGAVAPLVQFVGETAGLWYPMLGALSTLGGRVAGIPAELTNQLLIGGLVVYLAYLGSDFVERAINRFT
jgi:hypothetical protein